MMNQNNTGQYTLGRGRWLFDLFKPGTNTGTGQSGGFGDEEHPDEDGCGQETADKWCLFHCQF